MSVLVEVPTERSDIARLISFDVEIIFFIETILGLARDQRTNCSGCV